MVFYAHIHAYPTLHIHNIDRLITSLNDGNVNHSTIKIPGSFEGKHVQSAIDFHRAVDYKNQDVHPTLFIVLETQDTQQRGVLLVNLDYHNQVDAVRLPVGEAGISICSLSIDNTTWQETRESCNDLSPPLTAAKLFLVYGLKVDSKDLKTACQAMNDGLGALNVKDEEGGFAEYRSIHVQGPHENELGNIKTRHREVAQEMGCSKSMFAVIEPNYKKEGVLLIKLGKEGSREEDIRQKLPLAGEVLVWVFLGFWRWDEVCRL